MTSWLRGEADKPKNYFKKKFKEKKEQQQQQEAIKINEVVPRDNFTLKLTTTISTETSLFFGNSTLSALTYNWVIHQWKAPHYWVGDLWHKTID